VLSHSWPIQSKCHLYPYAEHIRSFNITSYSRQVWDKIGYEARHYFSVSEHITPDILSRELLAAEQAEEQLNTLDQYIQENA
jgi:hypothetical protein